MPDIIFTITDLVPLRHIIFPLPFLLLKLVRSEPQILLKEAFALTRAVAIDSLLTMFPDLV